MSYTDLKSYQQATIIYDFTVEFCRRYIRPGSRTRDQMEQAARSGKQNIAEGCQISRTSKKSELKLINVARASLQELLEDYQDYLRQHSLPLWGQHEARTHTMRNLAYRSDRSYTTYKTYINDPEQACNAMICLIHQTNYLLDQQIRALETAFLQHGGYTENLFKRRLAERYKS